MIEKELCNKCSEIKVIDEFALEKGPNGKLYRRKSCNKCRYKQRSSQSHYKEWKQETSKKDYEKRKDKILKANAEYKRTPKGKCAVMQSWTKRKRLTEGTCDGSINYKSLKELFEKQEGLCIICNIDLKKTIKNLDHIYPISKGGDHTIDNVQYLCKECNILKADKIDYDRKSG